MDGSEKRREENEREKKVEWIEAEVEDELKEEDIWKAIKRIKNKKATGIDGMPMVAWKYVREA